MRIPFCILVLSALFMFACKKDSFVTSPGASIRLSSDTLFFDTVFTTTGSITQSVKIINDNDGKIRLSDIRIMGGAASYFSINVDGTPGPQVGNQEIDAGDSLYIFVAVTIHPNAANLPFIVQDSIGISFNGNRKFLQLQAYGQNAHFFHNKVISSNTEWDNSLPYVITGSLRVDTNAELSLMPGCRIYCHADAPILVDGTLLAIGGTDTSSRIVFAGDRLDYPYSDFPGSWPGIYFRGSSVSNVMRRVVVKNAYQAIAVAGPATNILRKLTLEQSVIDNSYDAGILAIATSLSASNCLISNCGKNIQLTYGGDYSFDNCTVASFSNEFITHSQPVLYCNNYNANAATPQVNELRAHFLNCIFWGNNGNVDNEVQVSQQNVNGQLFDILFTNCLWKVKTEPVGISTIDPIANVDPQFDSVNNFRRYYDFHLKSTSPLIDKGAYTPVGLDLDGNPRSNGTPDIGCYERQK